MGSVVLEGQQRKSGLIIAFILLLGGIVRCRSETDMDTCLAPMVRRRQPYSSALVVMQAGSQESVG